MSTSDDNVGKYSTKPKGAALFAPQLDLLIRIMDELGDKMYSGINGHRDQGVLELVQLIVESEANQDEGDNSLDAGSMAAGAMLTSYYSTWLSAGGGNSGQGVNLSRNMVSGINQIDTRLRDENIIDVNHLSLFCQMLTDLKLVHEHNLFHILHQVGKETLESMFSQTLPKHGTLSEVSKEVIGIFSSLLTSIVGFGLVELALFQGRVTLKDIFASYEKSARARSNQDPIDQIIKQILGIARGMSIDLERKTSQVQPDSKGPVFISLEGSEEGAGLSGSVFGSLFGNKPKVDPEPEK